MTKRGLRGYTIPVYEADGVTQIGVFQVGGPGTTVQREQADGDTVTRTADADGNIITTTTHPDGTVTIETEALDGTVTTKTLTAAEAKRLKQETATPKPTATPTHEARQAARLAARAHVPARSRRRRRPSDRLVGAAVQVLPEAHRGRQDAGVSVPAVGDRLARHPARRLRRRRLEVLAARPGLAQRPLLRRRATSGSTRRATTSRRRRGRSRSAASDQPPVDRAFRMPPRVLALSFAGLVCGRVRPPRRTFPANFATFSQLWYSGPAVAEEKPLQIGTMPS